MRVLNNPDEPPPAFKYAAMLHESAPPLMYMRNERLTSLKQHLETIPRDSEPRRVQQVSRVQAQVFILAHSGQVLSGRRELDEVSSRASTFEILQHSAICGRFHSPPAEDHRWRDRRRCGVHTSVLH